MKDEDVIEHLRSIDGEEPADRFVASLRTRLDERASKHSPAMTAAADADRPGTPIARIEPVDPPTPRRWLAIPLAAAAALIAVFLVLQVGPGQDSDEIQAVANSPEMRVGTAWLDSIVANDRDAFAALHAPDLEVDDTMMGYSQDLQILTPERVGELYLAGFDAYQASLDPGGNRINAAGCAEAGPDKVRCTYTTSLLDSTTYSYSMAADLTLGDGLITAITFTTETEPADLRSHADAFFDSDATDEDVACMVLGFNTIGCGEHDADFMTRYIAFYEAQSDDG